MSKPMRWGFIGASNIAERVIPAFRPPAARAAAE